MHTFNYEDMEVEALQSLEVETVIPKTFVDETKTEGNQFKDCQALAGMLSLASHNAVVDYNTHKIARLLQRLTTVNNDIHSLHVDPAVEQLGVTLVSNWIGGSKTSRP